MIIVCLSDNTVKPFTIEYVIASRSKRLGRDIRPKLSCPERVDPEVLGFTPSEYENNCRESFNSGLHHFVRNDD